MKRLKSTRWWNGLAVAGLLFALAVPLVQITVAEAAGTSCTWSDQSDITCGTEPFTNPSTSGATITLLGNITHGGNGNQCAQDSLAIGDGTTPYQNAKTGTETTYTITVTGKFGSVCTPHVTKVNLTNTYASVPAAGGGTSSQSPQLACSTNIFNPLTWLICPIVSAAQGLITTLSDGIDSMLAVNTCTIFSVNQACTGTASSQQKQTSSGFYQAWNIMRIFAIGFVVIAGLVMLIAEAAGAQIVDSYTIHKVLPRLLIAIIFIALSWQLMNFFITLSNDLGLGVRALIYAPFHNVGDNTIHIDQGSAAIGALAGSAALLTMGLLGLLSFALTGALALFVGFITLLLRQLIIMTLVIFAPIGIACYILPGTEKGWRFWRDTLVAMLIAFPIISAVMAMGQVMAVILYNGGF